MSRQNLKDLVALLTEEQQQSLYEAVTQTRTEKLEFEETKKIQQYDIAIIGLNGRYPQADNHYEFWLKLKQGTKFIKKILEHQWYCDEHHDSPTNDSLYLHKKCYKFGTFLKAHDTFDASFFDLTSDEISIMDPRECLALETVWSCIEDAGYTFEELGNSVGIFTGITPSKYQTTNHSHILNDRIADFFNFQGPALIVNAGACSSLTAIHLAGQSLMRKECQTALVIGANILDPNLCTDPFDTDDDRVLAEGVVSILLKPLQQALLDKDHIYAVIKSCHICHEENPPKFMVPDPKQQAKLIQANFEKAGIHPATISYMEAAANGSSVGDVAEIEGLILAFNQFINEKQFCPIGSVQSIIGHGEAVSTLLQLTKVLLQFKTKMFIPLINLPQIGSNINIKDSPFYFQTSTTEWIPPVLTVNNKQFSMPRRAMISSIDNGGNNGHLILEEHIVENTEEQKLDSYFIPLSSKTNYQLQRTIENYIQFIERYQNLDAQWETNYTLSNIMFTLCVGRVAFSERVVFITDNLKTLVKQLRQFLNSEISADIISTANVDANTMTENCEEAQVQSYLNNHSWHKLAKLWVQGSNISWKTFFHSYNVYRISLPTYCFQKQIYPVPKAMYSAKEEKYIANKENNNKSYTEKRISLEPDLNKNNWSQFPELIHLNQVSQGRPVFWLHGGSGGVEGYQSIAQKSQRPFYGIQARGWMTGGSPLEGIQAMASYYVHIIQSVQLEGPYDLGGFSLGGALAYEITRQLQGLGQNVNTIVMLDSPDSIGMRKVNLFPKDLILQAVNMELMPMIRQEPEKSAQIIIRQEEVDLNADDEVFLQQVVILAKTRGLAKTEALLRERIQNNVKLQQAYKLNQFSILPLTYPQTVTCYYFRNKNGVFFGEFVANAEDKILLDHTKYWGEWEEQLPNFHIIDVDSSSHMMLLLDPKTCNKISILCKKLYSLDETVTIR